MINIQLFQEMIEDVFSVRGQQKYYPHFSGINECVKSSSTSVL